MGYKRKRKVYKLTFQDPSMDGLEVIAGSLTTDEFLALSEAAASVSETDNVENRKAAAEMFDLLGKHLVSWTLEEEDDTPVPATRAGIGAQDLDFILDIVLAWMNAIASVPPPLPEGSPSGATSLEQSLPQVSLSQSHSS